jgi:hypothetical protein
MSLNPYEIRLELLKLAQHSLNEKIYNARQGLMDEFHANRDNNASAHFPKLPEMPTTEDIIAEAKKLNNFVTDPGIDPKLLKDFSSKVK